MSISRSHEKVMYCDCNCYYFIILKAHEVITAEGQVSLAPVLKRNLELFLFSSPSDEEYTVWHHGGPSNILTVVLYRSRTFLSIEDFFFNERTERDHFLN